MDFITRPSAAEIATLVGRAIEAHRRAKRVLPRDLAKDVGMPELVLLDVERGVRMLSVAELHRVADALGVRPGLLADGELPPKVVRPPELVKTAWGTVEEGEGLGLAR